MVEAVAAAGGRDELDAVFGFDDAGAVFAFDDGVPLREEEFGFVAAFEARGHGRRAVLGVTVEPGVLAVGAEAALDATGGAVYRDAVVVGRAAASRAVHFVVSQP